MSDAAAARIEPPMAGVRRRAARWTRAAAAALLVAGCTGVPGPPVLQGMALSSTPLIGKFVWRDLVTENPAAVKPFYAALFGWEYEETTALGQPYTLVKSGGQFIAGIGQARRKVPDQAVSQWLSFVSVADVDRAAELTRREGGQVVAGPLDLPRVGRGAVVIDPEGAPLGLLRSTAGDPVDTPAPVLNRFLWTEHLSIRPQETADFYARLAGFQVRKVELGGSAYWLLVQGRERAGLLRNPLAADRPVWLSYVMVADAAASAQRAAQLGGRVLLAPRAEVRGGTLALIADPTGAVLALQQWPVPGWTGGTR
jgi:predicted enzyme related to lactoylglutathione lyase